jgi:hypothetical protein
MPMTSSDNSDKNLIDDLFGPPPLIKGEDLARYRRLQSTIEHEINPKTFSDKVHVREMTDKLWEQQRYKQNVASLVEASYVAALASLLRPFYPSSLLTGEDPISALTLISTGEDRATALAREYYSGEANATRQDELDTLLIVHAISPEQIRAKAMEICGSTISLFNRMEGSCASSLRMLRKEIRHRDEGGKNASGAV